MPLQRGYPLRLIHRKLPRDTPKVSPGLYETGGYSTQNSLPPGISQEAPAPSGLVDRLHRQDLGARADEPVRLRLKFACARVEMNPVLPALVLRDLLQENLGAWPSAGSRL